MPGGARRVQDLEQVVGSGGPSGGGCSAERRSVRQGQGPPARRLAPQGQAGTVEAGQGGRLVEPVVGLGLADEGRGAGIGQLPGDLGRCEQCVEGHGHRAQPGGTEEGGEVVEAVEAEQRHPLPRPDAEAGELGGHRLGPRGHSGPASRLVRPVGVDEGEERLVARQAGAPLDEGPYGVIGGAALEHRSSVGLTRRRRHRRPPGTGGDGRSTPAEGRRSRSTAATRRSARRGTPGLRP